MVVCSTDDPADDLAAHRKHAQNPSAFTKLFPTWRPDRALALQDLDGWNAWVDKLGRSADVSIANYRDFSTRSTDVTPSFTSSAVAPPTTGSTASSSPSTRRARCTSIFDKARATKALLADEVEKFRAALLHEFALMDHARGWVQQFHLGAMRQQQHASSASAPGPTRDSIRLETSRKLGLCPAFSTASTARTSSRKPSSTI